MAREETLSDTSEDKIGQVVQGFASDGAINIQLVKKLNGKWDIAAQFPEKITER